MISATLFFIEMSVPSLECEQSFSTIIQLDFGTVLDVICFINVWRNIVFDIYFTEFSTALTTILPILFQYCYK